MTSSADPPDGSPLLVHQLVDPFALDLLPDQPVAGGKEYAVPGQVVLLSRSVDAEFDDLQGRLDRLGVPSLRIDADRLEDVRLTVGIADLRPTVVWTRRFTRTAMPAAGSAIDALRNDSWLALANRLAGLATATLPGAPVGVLDQLAGARGLGIAVPATIVTTSPAEAAAALPGDRVVLKVIDSHFVEPVPGRLYGIFAEVVERRELARRTSPGMPVIMQEFVPHEAEHRVYYCLGRLVAFDIRKSGPAAPWSDQPSVLVRPVEVLEPIATAVLSLAAAWDLRFGAFDFLVANGRAVFLEVNLTGDWRWYESKAGTHAVSAMTAAAVLDLHLRARGAVRPRPAGFDLLSFLGA